ncbi:hypothetical protein BAY60_26710 [Prauserella muralis]|uniref:LppX_LprAFG lipoprotein n=2 Tax=Prauserella muralis TaxID=588067 RepID=A0A2V4AMB3_9PSEU|nr:hypothetical protein BAY60_26710 [Prauserella muralis]
MFAVAGGAAAIALALTGCSQTTGGTASPVFEDTASLVRAAEQSTQEIKSAKYTMTMDMGMFSMSGKGQGSFDPENPSMAMTTDMDMSSLGAGKMSFEMRMVDRTVYLKMPDNMPAGSGMSTDKPWVKMSLEDMGQMGSLNVDQMLAQSDPTKTLELLSQSGEIVDTQPGQEVDGQQATKYTINVDFAKLAKQYGMDQQMGQLTQGGLDLGTIPVSVWIDERNLPLRYDMDMSAAMKKAVEQSGQQVPQGMLDKVVMSMKYYDWGEPVTVEAPPADQVGELPN